MRLWKRLSWNPFDWDSDISIVQQPIRIEDVVGRAIARAIKLGYAKEKSFCAAQNCGTNT
ncbi:MAG: hypothetical protein MZV63_17140 [Marinilabiliales bacterium]|nr:hypothetical protein [Marinilabiliales bacterium]